MLCAVAIRRVKIVCTIGPASDGADVLRDLIHAGMDVARINFSHGTQDEHADRIAAIRQAADDCGRHVAILQDLCGPKIRCACFEGGTRDLQLGDRLRLRATDDRREVAAAGELLILYPHLADDLHKGDRILLDDGRVGICVDSASGKPLTAVVDQPGQLRNNVGTHLPPERMRIATLTDKDKRDLSFGLSQGVDYVALSFVRNASEVRLVKDICEAWGSPTPVVAKIETPQAIDHLEAILLASDAVMIARGDLGVEFSPESVPVMQRNILGLARRHQTPVIVATEMMQSMTSATRPTRAEASDVATAVFEGTDAVMLSGETASGNHPALVVRTMHRIVVEAEQSRFQPPPVDRPPVERERIALAIAHGACEIADRTRAQVLVAFTETGRTARFASQARPTVPIIGLSHNRRTLRQLCLCWGIIPQYLEALRDSDEMIDRTHALLLAHGFVSPGDHFVTIYGAPVGVPGSTNAIHVQVVE